MLLLGYRIKKQILVISIWITDSYDMVVSSLPKKFKPNLRRSQVAQDKMINNFVGFVDKYGPTI